MHMILSILDKATEWISECLKNDKFVEELKTKYPDEYDKINWAQELLLHLFYALKDFDKQLIKWNLDIALEAVEKRNFELNYR